MICCSSHGSDAFQRGRLDLEVGRRTLLAAGAGGIAISAVAGAAQPARAAGTGSRRAYVIVLDGTRPEELDQGITPRLTALRDQGLRYPRAQSLPVMETIPNHVMMMTGVRPERSGVPANSFYDPDAAAVRDMDRETDILAPTVIEMLNAAGHTTGTVLSKEYLYGVFGNRATYRWEPSPVIPITGHAPDPFTMPAAIAMMRQQDPALMFVNLGDIDRVGHADITSIVTSLGGLLGQGATLPLLRRFALTSTDKQVGDFVDALKSAGRWDDSLLIFLADHSMDWSTTDKVISLQGVLEGVAAGSFEIAQNGGADLIYWTGPAGERAAGVAAMRTAIEATEGVLSVHTPAELRLGERAGELVAYAKAGWRFSDPTPLSNPIPGNHGHPTTKPIPFFLAGGAVSPGISSVSVTTMDVAPTVAEFFGLDAPAGGWQGSSRL